MRQISEATWECADPGMQFDTTINRWHTAPNTGRINASNPCSEYMHLDNSACNLASINLLKYLDEDGTFDVARLRAHRRGDVHRAGDPRRQRRLPDRADRRDEPAVPPARPRLREPRRARSWPRACPTTRPPVGRGRRRSPRSMTGHAYATSARTAGRMGPFAGYAENEDAMLNVLRMHRAEAAKIDEELVPPELLSAAQRSWDDAVELGERYGVRNSQATVLAPTGTIGLMMDCDTTGIEPDLALTKAKKLVGGGTMFIVNQTIPRALRRLGYTDEQVRGDRRPHRRAQDDHRCARVQPRAPAGVRLLDGRQHDPLHGSRHDDGRGAAVPVGRDLEDREPARGGDGRGGRAAAHRVVAARPQGGRDLPRQLQGRPAAQHPEVRRAETEHGGEIVESTPTGSSSGSSST